MSTPNGRPLLEVRDVFAGYLDFDILQGVNLEVYPQEVVCVIGPNGAGKSTVFRAVYGLIKVRLGQVMFGGEEITNFTPQKVLQSGIAIVPQLRSVFPQMTVLENLEMGMFLERDQDRITERIDVIFGLFPRLAERSKQMAGTMSGGEQRMLEIGRSLMLEPQLLMMDEPSAGLAPSITRMIFEHVERLNEEIGLTVLTVLMIEQNARQGLEASHRGYVLELGKNTYQGTGQELIDNPDVRRAFLGGR
jgi:ABC-type branched-subunit amino acid transport system ATPase component